VTDSDPLRIVREGREEIVPATREHQVRAGNPEIENRAAGHRSAPARLVGRIDRNVEARSTSDSTVRGGQPARPKREAAIRFQRSQSGCSRDLVEQPSFDRRRKRDDEARGQKTPDRINDPVLGPQRCCDRRNILVAHLALETEHSLTITGIAENPKARNRTKIRMRQEA